MVEEILQWYDQLKGLRSVCLRYFNAAGASVDGKLGEKHKNETHIIPLAIRAVQQNKPFTLFGEDYNTKDGTCVRDYIHIEDLCNAHLKALEYLKDGGKTERFNVGTGNGYSNKEIVKMIEQVSGQKMEVQIEDRRPGDANELVADATRIETTLGWKPAHSDLETIIKTAWEFHNENRH
jgi:UDP-glucose 4-epimerase